MSEHSETSTSTSTWPPDLAEDRTLARGHCIGNYRILEQIGAGGMGVVYRAQQLAPVQRIVAIKLVKLGIDTPQILARFDSERQALAVLEHPGIARVYDAGTTDTGRPYFVMEYVSGQPIGEYCDAKRLNTLSRLQLFEQVCHALQHAHYKGIIHRDLKPSNILVTEIDPGAPGQVKIIDFGIAKAMQGSSDSPFVTHAGQFIGTPAYTSPEQLTGGDVDTRADVFSLGVVLYELLSGTLPWDASPVAQQARSSDPLRPSTRLSTLGDGAIPLAVVRGTDAGTLCRLLRGDLDRIVMKAMHADRAQRYGTAAALAEDIRRHLAHEPVLARPPTLSYQARKFARRNRVLVTATAMVLVAILAGSILAVVGFVRARQALAREASALKAERLQREAADQVSGFLGDMLGSVDPKVSLGKPVLVRDLLDRASGDVGERFASQPVVAGSLHAIIANTYFGLGLYEHARSHAQAALEVRRTTLGEDDPQTLSSMRSVATSLRALSRFGEAESLLRDLIERRRRVSGPDEPQTCNAEESLGLVLLDLGRPLEAEPLVRHSLEVHRRTFGTNHTDTLSAINNMAGVELSLGRLQQAEALYRELKEARMSVLGEDHPWTIQSQMNLGSCILKQRRAAEAEPILRDALARSERVQGPDHARTLDMANALATAVRLQERIQEAEAILRDIVVRSRRSLGANHSDTILAVANLALILEQEGKLEEALKYYEEVHAGVQVAEITPLRSARYTAAYGLCLIRLKRFDQAEQPLLEAKQRLETANMASGSNYRNVIARLVLVCDHSNRPDQAARWRAEVKRLDALIKTATSGPSS